METLFATPGLLPLAVVCLVALFAALAIALVSGCGGAAIMFFWLTRVRASTIKTTEATRMWQELATPGSQDRGTL